MRIPLAREGYPFLLPAVGATALCAAAGWIWATTLAGIASLFLANFFRDPERHSEAPPDAILAPADGTILEVTSASSPETTADLPTKLVIFMSVFNCHVNRSPIAGRIAAYDYRPGRKLAAFSPKASFDNEQNRIEVAGSREKVLFKQIAGALARRIVFRKRVGDVVAQGERVGLIKFGSRVDLFLPPGASVRVKVGERVAGGLTILGELPAGEH